MLCNGPTSNSTRRRMRLDERVKQNWISRSLIRFFACAAGNCGKILELTNGMDSSESLLVLVHFCANRLVHSTSFFNLARVWGASFRRDQSHLQMKQMTQLQYHRSTPYSWRKGNRWTWCEDGPFKLISMSSSHDSLHVNIVSSSLPRRRSYWQRTSFWTQSKNHTKTSYNICFFQRSLTPRCFEKVT